jgi:hypothetical protein
MLGLHWPNLLYLPFLFVLLFILQFSQSLSALLLISF